MTPPPLIHQPDAVHRKRRTVYGALTAILWIIYAYLWVPLLTLVAWFIGVRTAWQRLYLEQNAVDPFLLAALPIIALICAVVLIGWAEYNRMRFADSDKRKRREDATQAQVAAILQADVALAYDLRESRIARLTMDEKTAVPLSVVVQRQ